MSAGKDGLGEAAKAFALTLHAGPEILQMKKRIEELESREDLWHSYVNFLVDALKGAEGYMFNQGYSLEIEVVKKGYAMRAALGISSAGDAEWMAQEFEEG